MRIFIAVGSGIKGSNTDRMADAFLKGAVEAGHIVEKMSMGENRVEGCRGCGACQRNGNHCVLQDDLQKFYPIIDQSDLVVLASPLYFWTISGQLKSFMDRMYAFSTENIYPHKKAMLLMTSGDDTPDTFRHAVDCYRLVINAMGWTDTGMCLRGNCKGGEAERREIPSQALQDAYELGRSIKSVWKDC